MKKQESERRAWTAAFDAGQAAGNRGEPVAGCPFPHGDRLRYAWEGGWLNGGGNLPQAPFRRTECRVCSGSGYMPRETNLNAEPTRRCSYCGGTSRER